MGLMGMTFLAWMVVRFILQLAWWALLLTWLFVQGLWFLCVTLPVRAIRRRHRRAEYDRLIDGLVQERVAGQRRIDGPVE